MKKLKYLFLILLMFIGINSVKAFDNTLKVYDYAQVITSEEEQILKESIDKYIETYNMDMVFVTVKYHSKYNTQEYAQDFYDYNNFGIGSTRDGLIFVIDFTFGYTDIYIATTGEAIRMYDNRINSMLDSIALKKNYGYFEMAKAFINSSYNYASQGIPSSNKHTGITTSGDIVDTSMPWDVIIIVSFIIPTIVLVIFMCKNKMVKKSTNAAYYIKDGSVVITSRNDKFITTHTTSVRISDSQSSGGRVGGSSVSRGSSGISHGGGGRRL